MEESFALSLGQCVKPGLVALGIYDGIHPCLTLGTLADRICIHNPHEQQGGEAVTFLNIHRPVTSLVAGRFGEATAHDVLVKKMS